MGPVKATYVPGPGAYDYSDAAVAMNTGKTISGKLKGLLDALDMKAPGPGAYNSVIVAKNTPGGKFGVKSGKSAKELENSLGPGSYNLRGDFTSV